MAVTTVEIFRRFYQDQTFWKEDDYHQDECITVSGELYDFDCPLEELDQSALMSFNDGAVYRNNKYVCTFDEWFERWRSRQMTMTLVVNVPRARYSELVQIIKELGGTYDDV